MDATDVMLQVQGLSKSFGGLHALRNVSLQVRRGEVHAVVGENGAGKSTLMKILAGIILRDSGRTTFKGVDVSFTSPRESIAAGIAIIHQELSVLPTLNVIENVFMGRMPTRGGRVLWKELETATREALAGVGLDINPRLFMSRLSISQRQLIEIAKALSIRADLIIMDEPNSSLSETETARLFSVIESLKARGVSIVYVSHKIEEVLRIADRITVLRDGAYVGTVDAAAATVDSVIRMMVGRELTREYIPHHAKGDVVLSVHGLSGTGFSDVSFDLRKGEILCFAGLVGAGRSETWRAIFGADRRRSGEVVLDGRAVSFSEPSEAIAAGLAMVPEDRKKLSLFMDQPIWFNIAMAGLPSMKRGVAIDHRRIAEVVRSFVSSLAIKIRSSADPVRNLSGGNQQKTVLARWLALRPKVLILDEPTHGIDVGAKSEIYELIRSLAREGIAVALISSELPEVIAMADRAVVMHEGSVTGILGRSDMEEHRLMAYATGTARAE
ncbi:MAG TPA: sugar ABC transporter ATP-binding protein [Spirochaetia bacterium]|nr:sugar ABC transporter ATP-binding protein [Spirochaetia bacterium]